MQLPILVTGSQGFLGRHLRAALARRGIPVIGADLPESGAEVEVDLASAGFDANWLASKTGKVQGIIHLAARISRGSSVDAAARANLVTIADAPARIWEAYQAAYGTTHLVYCSTFKTYGPASVQPIDPEQPPQRPDPHSYGTAKALAERFLKIVSKRLGTPFAVVRSTCIYGPGQHLHNAIPLFLRSCLDGKSPIVYGDGLARRDDVLVTDLAYCLIEASLRRASGAFHGGGEHGRTILEVAKLCCRVVEELGGPSGLEPRLDPSRPPKWWLDQSFDIASSRRELSYTPTAMAEGLRREAAWIRAGARPEESVSFGEAQR